MIVSVQIYLILKFVPFDHTVTLFLHLLDKQNFIYFPLPHVHVFVCIKVIEKIQLTCMCRHQILN